MTAELELQNTESKMHLKYFSFLLKSAELSEKRYVFFHGLHIFIELFKKSKSAFFISDDVWAGKV